MGKVALIAYELRYIERCTVSKFTTASRGFPATARLSCHYLYQWAAATNTYWFLPRSLLSL